MVILDKTKKEMLIEQLKHMEQMALHKIGWQLLHLEEVPEDAEFWSRIRGKGPKTQLKEEQDYIEVEAPNSVIEAMKKASEHKGKKIRFVRRKS